MSLGIVHISTPEDYEWRLDEWRRPGELLRPVDYLRAARVPASLSEQTFGLWSIERVKCKTIKHQIMVGAPYQTILRRITMATVHLAEDNKATGEIVMEDSRHELSKHLPIWLAAHGRVLITGLGLGCVVRGLLINPAVTHIDVVELDPSILRIVGAEFRDEPRVTLHYGDALKIRWPRKTRWDFAWHDIIGGQLWTLKEHTQILHARLVRRYFDRVDKQGCWEFPRHIRHALARGNLADRFL